VHFEFEGCCLFDKTHPTNKIDFSLINKQLKQLNIDADLVPEYWKNQWEYVSQFNGQSPLKEAQNLASAIEKLPLLFQQQGIKQTLIKPVVWSGDQGKVADKCHHVFINGHRIVHIPNAVQINVSVLDKEGNNLVAEAAFGEYLQRCFMETSLSCCLLYLPEEEAFDRLSLKTRYGLSQELCSPNDISGGHQGSIALYQKIGKHNQAMGVETLLYDHNNQDLVTEHNWQKTARIEHRLGASSRKYDPFVNVVFALLNIIDALNVYITDKVTDKTMDKAQSKVAALTASSLPYSLYKTSYDQGAIALFEQNNWFNYRINEIVKLTEKSKDNQTFEPSLDNLGGQLKTSILSTYQPEKCFIL
jgi:hypothetical protein